MSSAPYPKALVAWFALMLTAVANGAFREAVLAPWLRPADAHVVSTLLGSAILAWVIWLLIPWLAPPTARAALGIGTLWLVLTVAFEFTFGHYVALKSWSLLLADYNLSAGRLWPLVLVVVTAAPYATARLRGRFTRFGLPSMSDPSGVGTSDSSPSLTTSPPPQATQPNPIYPVVFNNRVGATCSSTRKHT